MSGRLTKMVAVLQPTGRGKLIAIDRAVVLVGRSADCDVVITSSRKISRKHCCLVHADEQYFVRDLDSMNGIWLNGKRVTREARMKGGDRLSIGDVEFLFHTNVRVESRKPSTAAAPVRQPSVDESRPVVLVDETGQAADSRTPPQENDVVEIVQPSALNTVDASQLPTDQVLSVEALEVIDDVELIDDVEVVGTASDEVEIVDVIDDVVVIEDDDDIEILDEVEVVEPGPRKRPGREPLVTLDDSVSIDDEDLLIFDED